MRLAESGDQGFGESFFQTLANLGDGGRGGRQAKQESFRGAASGHHETGAVQAGASHHHAGTDVEAAQHAIWFISHLADYSKCLATELEGVADFQMQAQQDVVRDGYGVGSESAAERGGRRDADFAVE